MQILFLFIFHQMLAYKPIVVIHGLKEKPSDLDFLTAIIKQVRVTVHVERNFV